MEFISVPFSVLKWSRGTLCVLMASIGLSFFSASMALAQSTSTVAALRIGVVNMNVAINQSQAGNKSKRILATAKQQKQEQISAEEAALAKRFKTLRDNVVLSETARKQREQALVREQQTFRQRVSSAERELQAQHNKMMQSIVVELRTVISKIAKEEKLDFVLEATVANGVLYSKVEFLNITEKVIAAYNTFQK